MTKKLESYIDVSFKQGFFLSIDSLYKIKDIIGKRLLEIKENDLNIKFSVSRRDGLKFTTEDIGEIEAEYNSEKDLIESIQVNVINLEKDIIISFDSKKEETTIFITGFEKDFTSLLYTDLNDYLFHDILKFRKYNFKKSFGRVLNILAFCFMIYVFWDLYITSQPIDINSILQSDNVVEKLNYLIKLRNEGNSQQNPIKAILSLFILGILVGGLMNSIDYYYPRNIFYIGDQKKKFDRKKSHRSYFWGTIVGGLVLSGISYFIFK